MQFSIPSGIFHQSDDCCRQNLSCSRWCQYVAYIGMHSLMHQCYQCVCNEFTLCGVCVHKMAAIIRIFVYFDQPLSKSGITIYINGIWWQKINDSVDKIFSPLFDPLQWFSPLSYFTHPQITKCATVQPNRWICGIG